MNEISKAKPPENAGEETITEIIQENIPNGMIQLYREPTKLSLA